MRMKLAGLMIGATLLFNSMTASCADAQNIILSTVYDKSDTCEVIFADSTGLTVRQSSESYMSARNSNYRDRLLPIQINRIIIPGKSQFGPGLGLGFLTGFGTGAIIGVASGDDKSGLFRFSAAAKAFLIGVPLGVVGAIVGGIIGASHGRDDEFFINGHAERYLAALPRLQKFASRKSVPEAGKVSADTDSYPTQPSQQLSQTVNREPEPLIKKFHIAVGGGLRLAGPAVGNITDAFNSSGFGGTVDGLFGPATYPTDQGTPIYWSLAGEYSISDNLRLGVSWTSDPVNELAGRDRESESTHSQTYALILTYVPSPVEPSLITRSEFGVAAGLSYNLMNVGGSISSYNSAVAGLLPTQINASKNTLGFILRLSYDYYLSRLISLQLSLSGNLIPEGVNVPETNYSLSNNSTKILTYHSVNFSGLDLSTAIRIHL